MRLYTNKKADTYEKQFKITLLQFINEAPYFVFLLISAIIANNLLIWTDLVVSLSTTIHVSIVLLVTWQLRKETGDRFNFGMDRYEVFISFICDILLFVALAFLGISAVKGLIEPKELYDDIFLFIILKVCNCLYDFYIYYQEVKVNKKSETNISKSELNQIIASTSIDLGELLFALLAFFFRSYTWACYVSPIGSLIIITYFVYRIIVRIIKYVKELSDFSLSIKDQDEIFDIVLSSSKNIEKIVAVNCRTLNSRIYIEIVILYEPHTTYETLKTILASINEKIKEKYPNSITKLVIELEEQDNSAEMKIESNC